MIEETSTLGQRDSGGRPAYTFAKRIVTGPLTPERLREELPRAVEALEMYAGLGGRLVDWPTFHAWTEADGPHHVLHASARARGDDGGVQSG